MLQNEVSILANSEDQHEHLRSPSPGSPTLAAKPPGEGRASWQYANGSVKLYEGEFKAGMRHGKGVATFADGVQYRGGWRLDKKHGVGEEVNSEHTTYRGEYSMGLRHGKGLEITVYGDEYNGEWSQGLRSGAGDYFSDGIHYVGGFLNGDRHGACEKCIFRNGDFYSGEFKSNLMEGKGSMITAWGAKYEGSWFQGKMHGHGTMLFPSGDSYTGEWINGRRSGQGIYKSESGASYEGEWDNGKRHGKGIFRSFRKVPSSNFSSIIPFRFIESDVYDGGWRHGLRHGEAIITKKGQITFQGTFLNDKRDGDGKAVLKDGSIYAGGWQEGLMHGRGKIITETSESEGVWNFGICKQVLTGQIQLALDSRDGQLAAFEKGRNRILSNRLDQSEEGGDQNEWGDSEAAGSESSFEPPAEDALTLRALAGLDHIEEGDEATAVQSSFDPSTQFELAGPQALPASFLDGLRLPQVGQPGDGVSLLESSSANEFQPLKHDELVNMSAKHGVQVRGQFDREGRYIPPVTKETLDEWNYLNAVFSQARSGKGKAAKAESPYSFDVRRPPGYGEGANIKQAKLRAPRKTDKEEAEQGEFSYRRWRVERGDSREGRRLASASDLV